MTTTDLPELAFILVSGILGSAHCIGMCGGISATMSLGTQSWQAAVTRQLLWSGGRIMTYVFLGISAAACGAGLLRSQSNTVRLQSILAIVAGVLLLAQGLHATGLIPMRLRRRKGPPCMTRTLFSQFLKGGSGPGAFVAGLLTGFLPCGLVYSFLALAVSSGSPLRGAVVMLSFGLGTVPVMLATGTGFSMATVALRKKVLRLAAICVMATGIITMARGISFAVSRPERNEPLSCPFCIEDSRPPNSAL